MAIAKHFGYTQPHSERTTEQRMPAAADSATVPRRNLSGLFIFDTLPGEPSRRPTCVEDCTDAKRLEWLSALTPEGLARAAQILDESITGVCKAAGVKSPRANRIPEINPKQSNKQLEVAIDLANLLRCLGDEFDVIKISDAG